MLALSCLVAGCGPSLPGGYSVRHADRGKAWLRGPDGTLVDGATIKALYRSDRHIVLIGYAEESASAEDRVAVDDGCYVALLIDAATQQVKQISIADAARRAARMARVESYDRPCV